MSALQKMLELCKIKTYQSKLPSRLAGATVFQQVRRSHVQLAKSKAGKVRIGHVCPYDWLAIIASVSLTGNCLP